MLTRRVHARTPTELEANHVRKRRGTSNAAARFFTKETLVKGQPARIRCVDAGSATPSSSNAGVFTTVSLEDEWFEDLDDPRP